MQVTRAHKLRFLGLASLASAILLLLASKMEFLLPLLISARSSLDIFHEISFSFSWLSRINPASVLALFIIMGGLVYILARVIKRQNFQFDIILKMLLFWQASLLFWAILAPFNVPDSGTLVIRELVRSFTILMIYFLVFHYVTSENYGRYVRYIFISLVVPMALGFYQVITRSAPGDRIYGTLPCANAFGLYLVLFINLTVWRCLISKRKIFWGLLLIPQVILLARTFSATAMILLFFSALLWLLRVRRAIWIVLAIVLVFMAFPSIRTRVYNRVQRKISQWEIVFLDREGETPPFRYVIWRGLIEKWKEQPILGYGLSTLTAVNPTPVPPAPRYPMGYPKETEPVPAAAHNDYLRYLVELGVVGLSIYLFFLAMVGWRLLAFYKLAKRDETKNLAYALFVVFIAYALGSSVQNYAGATAFHFYFWAAAAILSKMVMLEQNSS